MKLQSLVPGFIAFALCIALDLVWFSVAGDFFKSELGSVARVTPTGEWDAALLPALIVYALMAVGIVCFVLPRSKTPRAALLFGALFGFVAYGVFDLTNLAILSAWTVSFAIIDMLWGTFLVGVVSFAVHRLYAR